MAVPDGQPSVSSRSSRHPGTVRCALSPGKPTRPEPVAGNLAAGFSFRRTNFIARLPLVSRGQRKSACIFRYMRSRRTTCSPCGGYSSAEYVSAASVQ
jgi:hypothetical protein